MIEQVSNVVHCEHLALRFIKEFHVERLKLYYGRRQDAFELVMIDGGQHLVDSVLGWRGNPDKRTTMEFDVKFADGDIVPLPWTPDLHSTQQFEVFCDQDPLLFPLRYSAKEAHQRIMEMSRLPITLVRPGDESYLDLRYFSTLWYDQLELPESMARRYILRARYVGWRRTVKGSTRIIAEVMLFKEHLTPWNNAQVYIFGSIFDRTDKMFVVDSAFAKQGLSGYTTREGTSGAFGRLQSSFPGGGEGG